MLEGQTITATPLIPDFPKAPAVMRILSHYDRSQVESFIEIAVSMLDTLDGDPDEEDGTDVEDDHVLSPTALAYGRGPGCSIADVGENAWVEWDKMRGSQKRGPNIASYHEDDEAAGDETDGNFAEDEECAEFVIMGRGAGCSISDPGGCEHDGREPDDDAEREQMTNDVPNLPVFTFEHNIFNDQRIYLGRSNLQSSFRTNGYEVRSADTGNLLVTPGSAEQRHPGSPV